ncbi:MAG: hypothetical protein RIQ60_2291 [Pseudomonadota bacterium]|jgi:GT2 family glycosyltransferase
MNYIILLNWNGYLDTIQCLKSLHNLRTENFRIVVCDNKSSDNSVEKICDWYKSFTNYSHNNLVIYDRKSAEEGGNPNLDPRLVLIMTGANLGFAGGNNVGIRYCLERKDVSYIWLLNNDTEVEPDALNALITRASYNSRIGMVGSTLLYYSNRNKIQARGGCSFYPIISRAYPICGDDLRHSIDIEQQRDIEKRLKYIIGASMLISRDFIENVGLMQEDYFMYYEELDWAERARRHKNHYQLAYAADSIVYHKVGASAGTSARSEFSLRLLYGNQLRFMRRFYPWFLVITRLSIAWEGIKALRKFRFTEAKVFFSVMWTSSTRQVRH